MRPQSEAVLVDVVHDLRQSLGTIETSAFLLRTMLPQASPQVREYLKIIERQVAVASQLLARASAGSCCPQVQRVEDDSLEFTKSATAVVT